MKIHSNTYYKIYLYLFLIFFLNSCSDELKLEEKNEKPTVEDFKAGFSLDFTVTLDAMGDSPTRADNFNPMKENEDFIDPQKFRVLFFDGQGKFLFESKSRWVQKLDKTAEDRANSRWYVSVPMFAYGNDTEERWNWDAIRSAMTNPEGGGFKIALLVNRPLNEYTSDYKGNGIDGGISVGWFPNNSPDWTVNESRFDIWGSENYNCKTIFDLHHCQWDPIYQNKSMPTGWTGEGYYNFIMGDAPNGVLAPPEPKLSPFVSWINWHGENDNKNNQVTVNSVVARKVLLPSESHPIPMYGVQNYSYIPESEWEIGSTFNLTRSTDLPISLLRSSVKLELVLPYNKKPDLVLLMYSNIYSRCEPLDVWTPTNELWKDHNDGCEWKAIQNYGPMVYDNDPNTTSGNTGTFVIYRNRLSWFYGAWKKDKWWNFDSNTTVTVPSETNSTQYPRIFNPCIQRNNAVYVYGKEHTETYFTDDLKNIHIITYTGERNINDPSKLQDMSGSNVGARTMIFWVLVYGSKLYPLPIADYSNGNNTTLRSIGSGSYDTSTSLTSLTNTAALNTYANSISSSTFTSSYRPWPLIRNHVYKLNIGNIATKSGDNLGDLFIRSEDLATPDIEYGNLPE